MQKRCVLGYVGIIATLVTVGVVGFLGIPAYAQTSSSKNYQAVELQFGSSTNEESCSNKYCSRFSIGELNSGGSTSAAFGTATYSEPVIEMIIEAGTSHLGNLTTEEAAAKTAIVKVRNYQTGGYQIMVYGKTPSYGSHYLSPITSPTTSRPGTEQFGINLVKNTLPVVGENIKQVPITDEGSASDIYGEVMPNYSTPDLFTYVDGDVVARSVSDTGGSDYTISMIMNISSATPAGHYAGDFSILLVPAY